VSDIEYLPAVQGDVLAAGSGGAHPALDFGPDGGDGPANVIGNDLVSEVEW
jgi:hypothetical protein